MADLINLTNTLRTASNSLKNYARARAGYAPGFLKEAPVSGAEIESVVQQLLHLDETIASVDRGVFHRVVNPELKS